MTCCCCRWPSVLTTLWMCAVLLLGAGCASSPRTVEDPASDPGKMGRMGRSPLSDFNLGEDNIPEVLRSAVADTYAVPGPLDCAGLGAEIVDLDSILGPDLDTLKAAERTEDFMGTALVGALRSLIPYRGVIRFLSGARHRERRILEAIGAGAVRRGYLKGLGESIGCAPPAAPVRVAPTGHQGLVD
jgi:hypothetical protein